MAICPKRGIIPTANRSHYRLRVAHGCRKQHLQISFDCLGTKTDTTEYHFAHWKSIT
jgi:hypothetical protein